MPPKPILAAIAVGLVIVGIFAFSIDWEARALRGRLDAFIGLVEKSGPENPLMSAAKASQVPDFFVDEPDIRLSDLRSRIRDKSEIKSAVLALRTQTRSVGVAISRYDLVLDRENDRADMDFRARVRITTDAGTESGADDIRIQWIKDPDQKWRIQSVSMKSER